MPTVKTNPRKMKPSKPKRNGAGHPADSPLAYIRTREQFVRYREAVDRRNAGDIHDEDRQACEDATGELERQFQSLTPMDRAIMAMRAQGHSFDEIAAQLKCSRSTVKRRFMKQITAGAKVVRLP